MPLPLKPMVKTATTTPTNSHTDAGAKTGRPRACKPAARLKENACIASPALCRYFPHALVLKPIA